MKIAIIDYGSGNLHSAEKAFARAAAMHDGAVNVTANPEELEAATHIVLPGVGAFGDCMAGLSAVDGMVEALNYFVHECGTPFLGICVGMQLMAEYGEENGQHEGLGWIGGGVTAIIPDDPALKIPHMGWNELELVNPHPLMSGVEPNDHAYFVHSYSMHCEDPSDVIAEVGYGTKIVAAVGRDNMMGVQFHPEKSQQLGLKIIHNFLMMER